jgi:hypothetical protein
VLICRYKRSTTYRFHFQKTPVQMAVEMHRTSVLDVLKLFIGSDPRYTHFAEEYRTLMKTQGHKHLIWMLRWLLNC